MADPKLQLPEADWQLIEQALHTAIDTARMEGHFTNPDAIAVVDALQKQAAAMRLVLTKIAHRR